VGNEVVGNKVDGIMDWIYDIYISWRMKATTQVIIPKKVMAHFFSNSLCETKFKLSYETFLRANGYIQEKWINK
jgi:hypothetical protein